MKSKEKEAYVLALILLLNPGEAKTESDSTKVLSLTDLRCLDFGASNSMPSKAIEYERRFAQQSEAPGIRREAMKVARYGQLTETQRR